MAEIPLRDKDGNVKAVAIVDDDDYEWVSKFRWRLKNSGYAAREQYVRWDKEKDRSVYRTIFLHREVNKTPYGKQTDHINRNKLDNRKSNLRTVDGKQNRYNQGKTIKNTSGYKGVFYDKKYKKWWISIQKDGVRYNYRYFKYPDVAHYAYCIKSIELFGEHSPQEVFEFIRKFKIENGSVIHFIDGTVKDTLSKPSNKKNSPRNSEA
jgi:hypothetical protein